jgi:hypothetical protein
MPEGDTLRRTGHTPQCVLAKQRLVRAALAHAELSVRSQSALASPLERRDRDAHRWERARATVQKRATPIESRSTRQGNAEGEYWVYRRSRRACRVAERSRVCGGAPSIVRGIFVRAVSSASSLRAIPDAGAHTNALRATALQPRSTPTPVAAA